MSHVPVLRKEAVKDQSYQDTVVEKLQSAYFEINRMLAIGDPLTSSTRLVWISELRGPMILVTAPT